MKDQLEKLLTELGEQSAHQLAESAVSIIQNFITSEIESVAKLGHLAEQALVGKLTGSITQEEYKLTLENIKSSLIVIGEYEIITSKSEANKLIQAFSKIVIKVLETFVVIAI